MGYLWSSRYVSQAWMFYKYVYIYALKVQGPWKQICFHQRLFLLSREF